MSNYQWENPSLDQAAGAAVGDALKNLRTAMPGRVVGFDPNKQTATVQPLIRLVRSDGQGVNLPVLADVPVCFPEGGGFAFTFPIEEGDEGVVIIADRCIDGWWQSGQPSDPLDFRLHDLSDGMFVPGINAVPNVVPAFATDAIVMRKFDGSAYFKIDRGGNIEADGAAMLIKCPTTFEKLVTYQDGIAGSGGANGNKLAGGFEVEGGELKHNGKNVGSDHRHAGVVAGGDQSGDPI
jgi:hypothetical protein